VKVTGLDFRITFHCEMLPPTTRLAKLGRWLLADADIIAVNIAACYCSYHGQ